MFNGHIASRRLPYPTEIADVRNRIQPLHLLGHHMGRPRRRWRPSGMVRIVAHVAEAAPSNNRAVHQVPHLRIDGRAVPTAPKHPAQQVLLVERGMHQRRRYRTCIEQQIHGTGSQMVIGFWARSCPNRDEKKVGLGCRPEQLVGIQRRHEEQLEGGIVVHR